MNLQANLLLKYCILLFLVIILPVHDSNVNGQVTQAGSCNADTLKMYKAGYAPVNGLKMYYEVKGKGFPIVLLHGAFMTIEGPVRQLSDSLSKHRRVISTELQGHGRTADTDRPLSYEQMADDVAALIRYLKIDSADIFGYSMGGNIAIQTALRYPSSVRKLIIVSSAISSDGIHPELEKMIPFLNPQMFTGSPVKKQYDTLAPVPENWSMLVNKYKDLEMQSFDWRGVFTNLKKPKLLIFGDSDAVTLEHAVEMFKRTGGGVMGDLRGMQSSQLGIIPGASHQGVMRKLDLIIPLIENFLNNP